MTKAEAYRVFGLVENQPITDELMKNRYRILIKTYHPDNPRTGNEEMMTLVNVAFEAIQNNRYDDEPGQDNFQEAYEESHDMYDWNKDFDTDDFMVDFDPFEFAGDDFAYRYFTKEEQDAAKTPEEEFDTDMEEEYESYEHTEKRRRERSDASHKRTSKGGQIKKKRNPILMVLKGIGKIFKFFILCGALACFAAAAGSLIILGTNERGIIVAVGAAVMGGLFILMFRFFGALIE